MTEDGTGAPLADYELCLIVPKQDPPRCTKSGADGSYTLYVPPSSQIAVSYRKDDYFPEIGMSVTETTDQEVNFGGLPSARGPLLASLVGATLDAARGQVVFSVFGPGAFVPNGGPGGLPGVTAALSPPSGSKPFYEDAAGVPDKSLTSTSTETSGGFLNVEPGSYTAIFTPPAGKSCRYFAGWPSPTPGAVTFLVQAGTITHVSVACE